MPVLLVLLLSGCSGYTSGVADLITPPKLTAEQKEILQVVERSIGENVRLKYPQEGNCRSPIIIKDIDQNGQPEAIVLYAPLSIDTNKIPNARINLLSKNKGQWESVSTVEGGGSNIDQIEFVPFSSTLKYDVFVSFTSINESEKLFVQYAYENGKLLAGFSERHVAFGTMDYGDKITQSLILISKNNQEKKAYAGLYRFTGVQAEKLGETEINYNTSKYLPIHQNVFPDFTALIYIDAMADGDYITEVLRFNDKGFSKLYKTQNGYNDFVRKENIFCIDVDGDGLYEIPTSAYLPLPVDRPEYSTKISLVSWYKPEDVPRMVKTGYYNVSFGYTVDMDEDFPKNITARTNYEKNEVTFVNYDPQTKAPGEDILSIKVLSEKEKKTDEIVGFVELENKNGLTYYAKINRSDQVSLEKLIQIFNVL